MNKRMLLLMYGVLVLIAVLFTMPFYWAASSSFKTMSEIFSQSLFPSNPTLKNYIKLFTDVPFLRWYLNSLLIAICYTMLSLFLCSLAGFAFAKYNFRGRNILFLVVLSTMVLPVWAMLIPLYIWFSKLHLLNTYLVLIIPGSANAFGIFFMRQYIHGVPSEMIDSARIDGCSEFRIYYSIVLPVIKPALGALAIFSFLTSWNNFLNALIFMKTPDMFTLPVALASFISQKEPQYGMLMAGGLLSVIPVLIFFLLMQRELISGLTLGSVKG